MHINALICLRVILSFGFISESFNIKKSILSQQGRFYFEKSEILQYISFLIQDYVKN